MIQEQNFHPSYVGGATTIAINIPPPPEGVMNTGATQNGGVQPVGSVHAIGHNSYQRFRSRNKKWSQQGMRRKHFHMTGKLVDILLVFITTTMLYEGYTLLVPYFFDEYEGWTTYYMKVFITFVYIQAMANWVCVKCYPAIYTQCRDRPNPDRKVWEDQGRPDQDLPKRNPDIMNYNQGQPERNHKFTSHPPRLMFNGSEVEDKWSELLDRERTVLSWRWCNYCELHTPPRAHHCKICNACILKRDHHCYLTNTCVGFNNQRFFTILCFYVSLACFGALGFGLKYLYNEYYDKVPFWDYFLPITIYQWWCGVYPIDAVFLVCHLYLLPPVGFMCSAFLIFQIALISTGKTPFELLKNLHLKNSHSVSRNVFSVFGRFWLMNFLLPFHLLYKQTDDPTNWPNMKICYRGKITGEKITKDVTV